MTKIVNFAVINSWLHIILITSERWAAVFYPLQLKRFLKNSASKVAVTIVWILSGLIIGSTFITKSLSAASKVMASFIIVSNILSLVLYFSIIKKIKEAGNRWKNRDNDQQSRYSSTMDREKPVVINCLLITVLFITLNFPILYRLLADNYSYPAISVMLVALDKLLNPGIYFFKSYCG